MIQATQDNMKIRHDMNEMIQSHQEEKHTLAECNHKVTQELRSASHKVQKSRDHHALKAERDVESFVQKYREQEVRF